MSASRPHRVVAAIASVALLFCLGVGACGEGEERGLEATATTDTTAAQDGRRDGPEPSGRNGGPGDRRQRPFLPSDTSARFTPESHSDSGGGSEQFRTPGGDNSVQEFGSESEDFEQAAAALHDFFDARAQRAWAVACESLAAGVVETLAEIAGDRGSCAAGLAVSTTPAAIRELRTEAQIADVGSVRTGGDRGFAIYEGQAGITYTIPLAREGGEWKLAALAGFPLG